jgi:gliding motility-associated-like protein
MRKRIALLFLFLHALCQSQPDYGFSVSTSPEKCEKGTAILSISGVQSKDTVTTEWTTGEKNTLQVKNLEAGDYTVKTNIRHWSDSVLFVTDTLLHFSISKETCPVSLPRYFSPNSDGYNDQLVISNADKHPNFELCIYDKWGQKVHGQKKIFIPWDGKWNGIDLPVGAYYYVFFFDADNKKDLVKGDVTILR